VREEVRRSLVSLEPTEAGLRADFRFEPELSVFEGHFPGRPLVPGAYLIEGVRQAAARQLGRELGVAEVVEARFTAPAGPGDALRIDVELAPDASGEGEVWTARARVECRGEAAAKLRLRLFAEVP